MSSALPKASAHCTIVGAKRMDAAYTEVLRFVAGATNLNSSVPQLAANTRNPQLASGQSIPRKCLQCGGNALRVIYGGSVGYIAMTTFATLGCLMGRALMLQVRAVNGTHTPAFT